jgi:hypothetical protein
MTNSVIEHYKENLISDLNKIYIDNNNKEYNISKNVAESASLEKLTLIPKENNILFKKSLQNVQISRTKKIKVTPKKMNVTSKKINVTPKKVNVTPKKMDVLKSIFRGFCYTLIITNKCVRKKCFFRHDVCIQ